MIQLHLSYTATGPLAIIPTHTHTDCPRPCILNILNRWFEPVGAPLGPHTVRKHAATPSVPTLMHTHTHTISFPPSGAPYGPRWMSLFKAALTDVSRQTMHVALRVWGAGLVERRLQQCQQFNNFPLSCEVLPVSWAWTLSCVKSSDRENPL